MSGLNYIKKYQAGSSVTDTTEDETTQPSIPVGKAVASKSPYALPTAAGNVAIDESILTRMQQLIAEREARKGGFAEGMLDAQAWWSGGQAGPYKALTERRAQKEADEATTFGMRRDIAQYRAAQERQKRIAESYGLGGAQPQAGGAAQPQAGGMAPEQAGGAGLPPYQIMLNSLPGNIQPIARRALATGDFEAFEKIVNEHTIKRPDLQKNLEFASTLPPEQQELIRRQLLSEAYKPQTYVGPSGSSYPYSVPGTLPPGVDVPGVPRTTPGGAPTRPAAAAPAMPAGQTAPAAAPEKDIYRFENLTPQLKERIREIEKQSGISRSLLDRPDAAENFNSFPMERRKAAFEFVPPAPTATAPTEAPALTEAPAPVQRKSSGQLEVEKEGAKETAKGVAQDVVKLANEVSSLGRSAIDREMRYTDVVNIVTDPEIKQVFGVLAKKGMTPFILKSLESGANVGQFGSLGIANLERNLAEAGATPKQIDALRRVEKHLKQAELEYARVYLSGQGAVSNAERQLVRDAVGSTNDPAKILEMQARVMAQRAKFDKQMAEGLRKYRDKNGTYADPDVFFRGEGQKIIQQHNIQMGNILGVKVPLDQNPLQSGSSGGGGTTSSSSNKPNIKSILDKYPRRVD